MVTKARKVLVISGAFLLLALFGSSAWAQTPPLVQTPVALGDVFIGVGNSSWNPEVVRGNGQIYWYSNRGDGYTLVGVLVVPNPPNADASAFSSTGMAFDASGNLYATTADSGTVAKFDNRGRFVSFLRTGINAYPQAILLDKSGNFYVGEGDGDKSLLKLGPSGALLRTFPVTVDPGHGIDSSDLAADQTTMFYTSAGPHLGQVDTSTGASAFLSSLGGRLLSIRLLPDGTMLAAHDTINSEVPVVDVLRLSADKTRVIATYTIPGVTPPPNPIQSASPCIVRDAPSVFYSATVPVLNDISLDPDGTSFWVSDNCHGKAYKIDLATKIVLLTINVKADTETAQALSQTNQIPIQAGGIAVFGEIRQGNLPSILANPSTLAFTVPQGLTATQNLSITSSGTPLRFRFTASVTSPAGGNWLSIPAGSPGTTNQVLPVTANATGLTPGTYAGSITITSPAGASNSPIVIPVSLTVPPPAPPPPPPLQADPKTVCPVASLAIGQPFFFALTATGGTPPYNWTATSLPPGLSLSSTGVIAGTPTAAGTFPLALTLTDAGFQTSQLSCSLVVTIPPLQIKSGCPAATGIVGTPFAPFQITATGGPNPSRYIISILGSLPDGLNFSGDTISGIPQTFGQSATFTIQVTSGNQTATAGPCSIAIAPSSLTVGGTCPIQAQTGVSLSVPFSAIGGQAPYSFSISGPEWLTIGPDGRVSGAPPADAGTNDSFTVTVTDSARARATKSCPSFPVVPGSPAITPGCPVSPQNQGTALTFPLAATGGLQPYTWGYGGEDPDLRLASLTGASNSLTGTLNTIGKFTLTVTLRDTANAQAVPLTCPLEVVSQNPPLKITPSAPCPAGPVDFGLTYSTTLTASGGNNSYSWSITSNDANTPFALNTSSGPTNGVSATLLTPGTTGYTVVLMDTANSPPASFACSFSVNQPAKAPLNVGAGPVPANLGAVPLTLTLPTAYPADLSGTLTLTFTSRGFGPSDNPMVTFSSSGTPNPGDAPIRTYLFTVPAGTTSLPLNTTVQVGRVFGTIRLQVTSLTLKATGLSVLPSPAPSAQIDVPNLAPVFFSSNAAVPAVQITNKTATGFDVVISAYSTSRDITSLTLTFNPANGAKVEGSPVDATAMVQTVLQSFFSNQSRSGGDSLFSGLRIPVTVQGDVGAIASVTVTIANAAGSTSTTVSVQ